MKKRSFKSYLALLPAVIIMVLIFQMSAREAEESTAQSMWVSYCLVDAGSFIFGQELDPDERALRASGIDEVVRKCAHMTEYAILTLSIWFAFLFWTNSKKMLYFSTVLFSLLYACSDEYHQTFVRGRSGKIQDVLVDSVGILLMTALLLNIDRKRSRVKASG